MKTESNNNIAYVSEGVNTTGFNIAVNDTMFRMLTSNIYSKPKLAVLREWSTNACDACIGADKEVVYDVHLPTEEDCTLSVRDYGTGLSTEDIKGLFSTLGESTKRNSDKLNGCFGIGRMAGLAVADAFTVDSFYKGEHHSYLVSVSNGTPSTSHFGSMPTEEPDGLRLSVTVPNQDIVMYQSLAKELYPYFDHKPRLNYDIDVSTREGLFRNDSWYIEKDNRLNVQTNKVVLSQVVYAIPSSGDIDNKGLSSVVIKAQPGDVTFNPGRESLSLDRKTVNYLNNAFSKVSKEFVSQLDTLLSLSISDKEVVDNFYTMKKSSSNSVSPEVMHKYSSKYLSAIVPNNSTYLSLQEDFDSLCDNLLAIGLKTPSYANAKRLGPYTMCDINYFMGVPHVILDLKTGFKKALNEEFHGKGYAVWQRNGKADLDKSVAMAKTFLDGMGLTYQLASELVETDSSPSVQRTEALYANPINNSGNVGTSRHITKDMQSAGKILYVKLSNTTPIMDSENVTLSTCMRLKSLLVNDTYRVFGVPKKYQKYVSTLDSWQTLESYLGEVVKDKVFGTEIDIDIPLSYPARFRSSQLTGLPKPIVDFSKMYEKYQNFIKTNGLFVRKNDEQLISTIKEFKGVLAPYEMCSQSYIDDLMRKHYSSMLIIDSIPFSTSIPEMVYQRLAMLEEYYYNETHKIK